MTQHKANDGDDEYRFYTFLSHSLPLSSRIPHARAHTQRNTKLSNCFMRRQHKLGRENKMLSFAKDLLFLIIETAHTFQSNEIYDFFFFLSLERAVNIFRTPIKRIFVAGDFFVAVCSTSSTTSNCTHGLGIILNPLSTVHSTGVQFRAAAVPYLRNSVIASNQELTLANINVVIRKYFK